ncbi:MAG: hypothetical protein EA398_15635 [Deltaproteobacteria bacterium]|nr:MAG: hypothetical protein EA398_15635 [Deltaproteobacteria bacterium]
MAEGAIFLNSGPLLSGEKLETLEETPEWSNDEVIGAAFERVRETFEKHATLLAGNPTAMETRFFMLNPTLHALGYTYSVHEPIDIGGDKTARVDYVTFPNATTFYDALPLRRTPGFFHQSISVIRAMEWGHTFEAPELAEDEIDDGSNVSPVDELNFLLRTTGTEYGILSNGCDWRLYHRATAPLLDTFFQADMIAAMKSEYEDFKRFFLVFNKQSFLKDDSGTSFIDRLLQ